MSATPRSSGAPPLTARARPAAPAASSLLAGGLALILVCAFLAGCRPPPASPPAGTPRLVVLIVVDQLSYDYLERTDPLLTGGLRRLLDEGVSFTEAHHAHGRTNTAPGHATLATGAHPSRHGVIDNGWRDVERDVEVYSAWDDDRELVAPTNLLSTTLGDWIKRRYPRSQVWAVAGKDRAAVLLGGHHADGAFWYSGEGGFATSRYYRGARRDLDELGTEAWPLDYFGRDWAALPVSVSAAADAGVREPERGELYETLPRAFGGLSPAPGGSFYGGLASSPALDELVARLALELVDRRALGEDEWPDLLALSFSALDIVGHGHGPHSPEALDVVLRLDRIVLGPLLAELEARVGAGGLLIALSADHGVVPLPELGDELGFEGYRAGRDDVLCLQRVGGELTRRFIPDHRDSENGGSYVSWLDGDFYLDRATLAEHGLDLAEVAAAAAQAVEECPIVAHAWTHAELADALGRSAAAFRHSLFPGRSPDLLIEVPRYALPVTGDYTTHGSPHRYDTHVPLVIAPPPTGRPGSRIDRRVRTVDLAPTLAEVLGVEPDRPVDGVSLVERLDASFD